VTSSKDETAKRLEGFRAAAHQQLDQWVDQQAVVFAAPKLPTLSELSAQFMNTRSTLLGGCLQAMASELTTTLLEQVTAPCPDCQKLLPRRRLDGKTYKTLQGDVHLERPYFYCLDCKHGFHPLDEALNLAHEAYQYDMQEKMLRLTAESPYAISAKLFTELTGLSPSDHCMHDTLNRIGAAAPLTEVIPSAEEIGIRIASATRPNEELPVLVVASDGAHTPTRPKGGRSGKRGAGKWREVKGFRIYLLDGDERIVQIVSWHQIQDAEQFTLDLAVVAARIPQDRVRIALLGDGAEWLWSAMVKSFPKGREVLDYFHCAEHVHKVAKIQYGETLPALQWAEATISRLFLGQVGAVIGGLKRMVPSGDEAQTEIKKLANYLDNHRHRFGYEECHNAGLPIGSGGIESANKHICHVRLKRSGAWWLEENGNTMLRLRCALFNGTFETVLENYISRRKQNI
jgi:hypothetical protein